MKTDTSPIMKDTNAKMLRKKNRKAMKDPPVMVASNWSWALYRFLEGLRGEDLLDEWPNELVVKLRLVMEAVVKESSREDVGLIFPQCISSGSWITLMPLLVECDCLCVLELCSFCCDLANCADKPALLLLLFDCVVWCWSALSSSWFSGDESLDADSCEASFSCCGSSLPFFIVIVFQCMKSTCMYH